MVHLKKFKKNAKDLFDSARHIDLPPEIPQTALAKAKLFSNRASSLELLVECKNFLEIGVLAGDFSKQLLEIAGLEKLTLVDFFESDDWPWIKPARFTVASHLDFIVNEFQGKPQVEILKGDSHNILKTLPSSSYDFIYIDANHSYEGVQADCIAALPLLRKNGIICFNDYIMHDYRTNRDYGIVKVVNELLVNNSQFSVIGLALNNHLFSDIYLQYCPD